MNPPPRLSAVTIGARDLPKLRQFYGRWGWRESEYSDDGFTSFALGSTQLSLYPLEALGAEAAPGEPLPVRGWNGITLTVNVDEKNDVDRVFMAAVDGGAQVIGDPTDREWGGRSAYVADPEGTRWELAWAPGWKWRFPEDGDP
jgi:catechol 2,3-dioxygenase-like lactoylglutathione lyase family enzyme